MPATEPASPAGIDCEPGETRCNGAIVEVCSAEAGWVVLQVCGQCNGVSYCDVTFGRASCLAAVCCFPEARCNGSLLEQCNANATGFEPVQDCGSPVLCDSAQGTCHPGCLAGQVRCNGAELQQCSADGTGFETVESCASAALCDLGLGVGRCLQGCEPGETRCQGTQLQRCNADRTTYEAVEECSAGCGVEGCLDADAGVVPSVDPSAVPGDPSAAPVPSADAGVAEEVNAAAE
jgi:hypothetical protein